ETESEPEPEYPGKFKPTLIVFAIALAIFLLGLDCTIFSTAILKVTEEFHALADVGWYASGYMLTFCAFQLTWGKVYTFCSIRWTYLVALFLFELGSIICAVVPSSLVLILERAIAGVGSWGTSVVTSQAVNRDESHVTVPKRVFKDRRIWADAIFGASIIGPFFIMLYYIPIWFQAIKGASAIKSGIMNLPMVLGFVIFSTLGGALTSKTGHPVPFTYLAVILTSIGAGLLTTFKPTSGHPEWIGYQWIGYQVIFGAGTGLGYQTTLTVVQTLPVRDVSISTSIVLFLMNLVGTVMLSVVENGFTNQLVGNLGRLSSGVDPDVVMGAGATGFREMVSEDMYGEVL
ncbi:uncharacterized protein ASPGLDRAFT_105131, partial [Aspergillus glaucus CBS 516.65]